MKTKIEWCDYSLNPIKGCTKISPGCDNCYAHTMLEKDGKNPFKVTLYEDKLQVPQSWRKSRIIFMVSMADIFHRSVPDAYIDRIFNAMSVARHHKYMILTKRPQRMYEYCMNYVKTHNRTFPKWVWLGVTAEDQKRADERLPILLNTPAHHHFVSVEPMLEPVKLTFSVKQTLKWLILGGEKAGSRARYMEPDWARDVRDQCIATGTPFFFKQMTNKAYIPADLNINQFPIGLK